VKVIRKGMFETNSSSIHSLVLKKEDCYFYTDGRKKLYIKWYDFDGNIKNLLTLEDKVSYLVTHMGNRKKYSVESYQELIEELEESYDFRDIKKIVLEAFDKELVFKKLTKSEEKNFEDIVSVNHELSDVYMYGLDALLEDMNEYYDYNSDDENKNKLVVQDLTLEEFLTNAKIGIEVDHD